MKKIALLIPALMLTVVTAQAQTPTTDPGVVINGVMWATRNVDAPGTFVYAPDNAGMFYQWNRNTAWPATGTIANWDTSRAAGTEWESANDPSPVGWRVPTVGEINTLFEAGKVARRWDTRGSVGGLLFTDLHNGNTLFLPAAGYRHYSSGELEHSGSNGLYWSSSRETYDLHNTIAFHLYFYDGVVNTYDSNSRAYGFCIRPVRGTGELPTTQTWNIGSPNAADVTATLNGTVLTISGTGAMQDFIFNYTPWGRGVTSVTIEEGVTSIGEWAFFGCDGLTSITIPEGVTAIGHGAFCQCYALASVAIPESVGTIGGWAFRSCKALTSVAIPAGVSRIEDETFSDCQRLTSIVIPESVGTIGEWAFSTCYALTSITIPAGVTAIGEGAFNLCTSLTSIVIPEGISTIENHMFTGCERLTSVIIPETVASIGAFAFTGCTSLSSIIIPADVTSIGWWAFRGCEALTSITNYAAMPQAIDYDEVFAGLTPSSITLRVPAASLALYQEADVWKEMNIASIGSTGIAAVPTGKLVSGYYTLQGIRLPQAPDTGVYIIKYDDGTAEKKVK